METTPPGWKMPCTNSRDRGGVWDTLRQLHSRLSPFCCRWRCGRLSPVPKVRKTKAKGCNASFRSASAVGPRIVVRLHPLSLKARTVNSPKRNLAALFNKQVYRPLVVYLSNNDFFSCGISYLQLCQRYPHRILYV
jgi:hypothetical protein